MKKLATAFAAIIAPVTLFALPNYDPFADATASGGTLHDVGRWVSQDDSGTVGTGQRDATGGQWYHAGNTANASPTITAGNLPYPGVLPAASGNKVLVGSTAANLAAGRYFHSSMSKALTSGGTASRFYSFVLQASDISALGASGTWIAGFNNTGGSATTAFPTVIGGRTYVKSVNSNTGFQIGLSKAAGDTPTFGSSPQTFTTSDTIFIVVEYVVNTGSTSDDVANMWINPSVATFANNAYKPTPTLSSGSGGDMTTSGSLQSFLLANSANSGQHYVDELRVAADWAGVTPSIITNQPSSVTTDYGQSASFSAGALAGSTYQWRKNNSDLSGETGTTLSLATVAQANEGSYTVVATLSGNSVTSAVATLTVNDPKVTSGPTISPSSSLPPGSTATISATAIGSPTLTYQWKKDGIDVTDGTFGGAVISGATTATLTIAGVRAGALGDGGSYTLGVTNGNGRGVLSSGTTLTVIDPAITTDPQSQTKNYNDSVTFSVTVAGTHPPFGFVWQKDGSTVTPDGIHIIQTDNGSTSPGTSTLTINNLTFADEATANGYRAVVLDNLANSTASAYATLTVVDPVVTTPVANVITNAGSTAVFKVQAAGSGSLTYAWKTNGVAIVNGATPWGSTISGASSDTLTISGVTATDGKSYVVEVSGAGPTVSSTGTLSVAQITFQPTPSALVINTGAKAVFAVGASVTGPGTLTYQWRKTGGDITGATSSAITIANAQTTDSDSYSARVTYGPGTAFIDSSSASLTVSSTALTLQNTNLIIARVGNGAQPLSDAGNSIFLDQYTISGTYLNTINIPDSGTDAIVGRGTAGSTINSLGGMTTLTRSEDGRFLVLNGYRTNYDANSTAVLGAGGAVDLTIPRAVATLDPSSQYALRIDAMPGASGIGLSAYRCAAFDGEGEYWGATGSTTIGCYYFGTNVAAGAITFNNARIVQFFNQKFYLCGANLGVFHFPGKPHPGDGLIQDLFFNVTGGSGGCDFAVSPDGNTIYVADGRNWSSSVTLTNGGIQKWDVSAGTPAQPIQLLKPDPDSSLGALYVTVDFSHANPILYATTVGASQNKLVKIVDDGSNSGAGTATVLATCGPNQEFRGVRFGPSLTAPASVTITNIINNGNGTVTINYTGGSGASFTLMKTTNLNVTRDAWTPVGANNSSTPGSFTITPAGDEFYAVRSN
jgi:hypothetical protein